MTWGREGCFQVFTVINNTLCTCPCSAYVFVFLHLVCYLLGLNSRSGGAGSKSTTHFTFWYIWPSCPLERLYQFTSSLSMTSFVWTFFILILGLSSDLPLPQMRPPDCRRKLGEHIFFFISPWGPELPGKHCHWGHFLRVALEVCGAAAAAFLQAERANRGAWGSLLKKWLRWMLSIVLSRLLGEAAWLMWPHFACEQGLRVAHWSLRRWPGQSSHCINLCTVGHIPPGGRG